MSKINVSQICLSNPKESHSYSQLYLANPEKRFLEKFGRLAILIDLNFKGETSNEIITQAKEWSQALIDFVKSNFYHPTRSGQDIEKEFENILQKTNNWLQKQKIQQKEFFEKYITNYDIDIINIFKNEVHFSQAGQIKAYLISNDQKQELAKENKETEFLNVISGSLEKNNILLFATDNLFEYFPDKKIIHLLKELPVDEAMNEIKQLLSNKVEHINLLALAISHRDESLISSPGEIKLN
ncbi:hypothetical protein IID20_05395, partial [Patescibacteria group bacterium]|nr:hypothetical protein [Patescibacteria group bacterium]